MVPFFSKINIYSIKTKLSVCFLLLSVLPVTIFAFFSYMQYKQSLEYNIAQYVGEVIGRMDKNIETYVSDIENILQMRNDYYVKQYLMLSGAEDTSEKRKYTVRIWETFNSYKQMKTDLADIRLISDSGQVISCYGIYWTDAEHDAMYGELIRKPGKCMAILNPHMDMFGRQVFSIGRAVDSSTIKGSAFMVIDIDVESLRKVFSDIKLGESGYVFLTDQNGKLVYLPLNSANSVHLRDFLQDQRLIGPSGGNFIKRIGNTFYNVTFITSIATGWKIVGVTPELEMARDINKVNQVCLLLIVICIIIVILLTIYLSNILTNPIRELRSLMMQASENDLSINAVIRTKDEIGQLGQSFNKMINRIRELLSNVVESQLSIRKMEMKAMQEQIKPHFIYNTLDSIIGLLEKNENDAAMNMLESLGKFLRISLSHGKEIIPVTEELDHVKNYLLIQQYKFSDSFDYIFEVDEALYKYKTIKLILQPLVENAIYHGARAADRKCLIIIKGYIRQEQMIIEIVDNGAGIESIELQRINDVLSGKEKVKDSDIYFGIRNVNERIKLNFGENYGLFFTSRVNVGTVAILNLPLIE